MIAEGPQGPGPAGSGGEEGTNTEQKGGVTMGAKISRAVVLWGVAALVLMGTVSFAEVRAAGPAPAQLRVYNGGDMAVDVALVRQGKQAELVEGLLPGDTGEVFPAKAGRVKLEVRTAGTGRARLLRLSVQLRQGHAYCILVGGPEGLAARDVSRRLLREPSPEKVCRELAKAGAAQ
jgi:hypothetical protein